MPNEMTLARVEAQTVAVAKARIKMTDVPSAIFPMMDTVWAFIRSRELTDHGHNVWLYRGTPPGDMDVEIGVQLEPPFDPEGDVVQSQTPAGMAAHTCHYGEYDRLPQVHQGLVSWCMGQGHELAGVSWEIYGDWDDEPAKRRTDIYHLCAEAEEAE